VEKGVKSVTTTTTAATGQLIEERQKSEKVYFATKQ